jgi:small neutral amino acid transporter SnatA (MarC family)
MDTTTLIPLLVSSIATFFAMCNPFANTPIFMGMTAGDDAATKKAIARRATLFAFFLEGFEGLVSVIVGFGVIMLMTYAFFLSGDAIEKRLGQSGITALTKIMGLILLTIGVQIFLGGLDGVLNEYLPTIPTLFEGPSS